MRVYAHTFAALFALVGCARGGFGVALLPGDAAADRDGHRRDDLLADDLSPPGDLPSQLDDGAVPKGWLIAVQSNLDDGELDGTGSYGTKGYAPQGESNCTTYMGGYTQATFPGGSGQTTSFFRFQLPRAAAADARVASAKLRLYARDAWRWKPSSHTLRIQAELSRDAARITSIGDEPNRADGRPLTSAVVQWGHDSGSDLQWTIGAWQTSPDLSAVIQEVIDTAGGLAANAHVQLFVYRLPPITSDGEVAAEDFCHGDGNQAQLSVTFQP